MAEDTEVRIDLRGDGRIILYKRAGLKDPVWQARIRVPNSTGYKRVARYADQLAVGDAVYVWRSQASEAGNAGVIAEGTIVESPSVQPDYGFASDIWAVTGFVVSH